MRTSSRAVLIAGLVSTALVSGAESLGWLQSAEWWTQDMRFMRARTQPMALSDQIRLVGIDDGAIKTQGRWPWSRDLLASAVNEIARAGARTVATDILFTEPQLSEPAEPASPQDAALAAALGGVPTVLAVQMDEGRLLGEIWRTPSGQEALVALTAEVVKDVTAPAKTVVANANLPEELANAVLMRPMAFKEYALWRTLAARREAGDVPPDLEAFRTRVTGGDSTLGQFAESRPVAAAFDRDRSFGLLVPFMPPGRGEGSPLDAPPIAEFAAQAKGVGFVNSQPDDDGQYRRVRPLWRCAYGAVPQFGLAAAIVQQRLQANQMRVSETAVSMPDGWQLPLVDGQILVDWPNAMFEPVGRVAQESAAEGHGVLSIGRLIEVSKQRKLLASIEARYRKVVPEIAQTQNLSAEAVAATPVVEATRAQIKEHGEFLIGDLSGDPVKLMEGLTEDERKLVSLYLEWWRLDESIRKAHELMKEAEAELQAALQGKLVFVGFMGTGLEADMINTVYGTRTPGVYFHAAVAGMALDHAAITQAPWWSGLLIALAMGVLASALVSRLGSNESTIAMAVALAAYIGVAGVWLFNSANMFAPLAAPVLAGGVAHIVGLGTAAFVNQRERARITRQFRARVSSQLVDQLVKNPNALSVRGEQRLACILFGDLAGFTTISEKLGSEAVVATLNIYMGALAKELSGKGAYVNKFLGDGVLAFWSAFGEQPDQCSQALRACVECQRQVTEIGQRPDRAGLPKVSLRLGLATGVVTVGDCGAPPELNDYTVIGDAANLSARLESANKQFGTAVLMDGATRGFVEDTRGLNLVRLGKVVVVGQSVPVELYTLLVEEPPAGWTDALARAVAAFEAGDFAACRAAFSEMERQFGETKIAAPYLSAMDYADDPRDGVLRLRAK